MRDVRVFGIQALLLATMFSAGPNHAADDETPQGLKHHQVIAATDWSAVSEIVIELGDHHYDPDELKLKLGKPYKLRLKNVGGTSHDMVGGTFFSAETIALRMINNKVGRVVADEVGSIYVRAKNDTEIWLVPLKAGRFSFFCSLPGHRESGMEGFIEIVQ